MSGDYDDEPIGYGRPPSWTQFRKGRSGNPKGRPPKVKEVPKTPMTGQSATDEMVRRELDRKVKVNDAQGASELSMLEITVRARLKAAVKGNVFAQRDVLREALELEAREAGRAAEAEREKNETFALIVNWRLSRQRVWDEAIANGCEPDDPWPHPDDILINKATRCWKIRGPIGESDLHFSNYIRAQRELLFRYMMQGFRKNRSKRGAWECFGHLMFWFDVMLPQRWQIGSDVQEMMALFSHFSLKDLDKQVEYWEGQVRLLTITAGIREPDRETNQVVAKIMKPIVNHYGYRSLAQFERTYEEKGEALVWPKKAKAAS